MSRDMLYLVPENIYDDFYWIFATVLPESKPDVFALTNDRSRDHSLLFPDRNKFLRWRANHLVGYSIDRRNNRSNLVIDPRGTLFVSYYFMIVNPVFLSIIYYII